jgi:hypothetical protein
VPGNLNPSAQAVNDVRFEVITVVTIKSTIFWDVTLCSLVKCTDVSEGHNDPIFRIRVNLASSKHMIADCLACHLILKMFSSATSLNIYQATVYFILEDGTLQS